MKREIEFRFWLGSIGKMTKYHDIREVGKVVTEFTDNIIPLQYVGLKDRKGNKIFDGDILTSDHFDSPNFDENEPVYLVKYDEDNNFFMGGHDINKVRRMYLHTFRFKDTVVLGNIYENPELLQS